MGARVIIDLAMIGEPKAAVRIKHDVIWPAQTTSEIARFVEDFNRTRFDVNAFDPPS